MTNGEVIQRVQSLYSRGVQSDDTRLEKRHIYNKLLTSRAKLLSQAANKKQKISQWNYQTIPCVKLVEAAQHECPCLPPVGCKIMRTEEQVPDVLSDLNRHLIQSVTSIEGSIIYDEIGWKEKKWKAGNKFTAYKPDYFIRNNYIYITYKGGPELIAITAIFESPLEAETFVSYCDDPDCNNCSDCESYLDKDFPLDNDMIETAIQMATEELIAVFAQMPEDRTNNGQDTEEQRIK